MRIAVEGKATLAMHFTGVGESCTSKQQNYKVLHFSLLTSHLELLLQMNGAWHSCQTQTKFQRLMKQHVIAKLDWNIFQYSFSFILKWVWTVFHWEIQNTILYFGVLQPRKTRIFGNSILVLLFNSLINLSELGTTVDINYRGFLLNNFFLSLSWSNKNIFYFKSVLSVSHNQQQLFCSIDSGELQLQLALCYASWLKSLIILNIPTVGWAVHSCKFCFLFSLISQEYNYSTQYWIETMKHWQLISLTYNDKIWYFDF